MPELNSGTHGPGGRGPVVDCRVERGYDVDQGIVCSSGGGWVNKARWFLEEMVKGAYEDWRSEPLSERRARCVAGFVNDMAEWAHHHLHLDYKKAADFREYMKRQHADFHIVVDVANGTKHVKLREPSRASGQLDNRIVTHAEQMQLHSHDDIDSVPDFDLIEDFDSLSEWIVELNDKRRKSLAPLLHTCIQMWGDFLKARGV